MRELLRKELREVWRTRRFLIVVTVLLVFGLLGPLSIKYMPLILTEVPGIPEGLADIMPEPDVAMAVDEYVQNLAQLGIVLAILVPMGAVVRERKTGTAAMVLSKPISRATFLGAKWLLYILVFLVGVLVAGLGGYYYLGALFEWLDPLAFLALNGLILIYLIMFLAITLFMSSVCPSQLAAAGASFGALLVLGFVGIVPSISSYLPAALMGWGRALVLGQGGEAAWASLALTTLIIGMAWFGSWLSFRNQEL
jgi:ABC-2 type transport system permease protein